MHCALPPPPADPLHPRPTRTCFRIRSAPTASPAAARSCDAEHMPALAARFSADALSWGGGGVQGGALALWGRLSMGALPPPHWSRLQWTSILSYLYVELAHST